MESPTEFSDGNEKGIEFKAGGKGGGGLAIPFIAEGKVEASGQVAIRGGNAHRSVRHAGGLIQVAKEIANSSFVIFLDDFHYIARDVQADIGKQIKAAAERGVRICVASVPHRSDDVFRSNAELHGRIKAIDIPYWDGLELGAIARQGFGALHHQIPEATVSRLSEEAFGSPQLMQTLCLNYCFERAINSDAEGAKVPPYFPDKLHRVFERASTYADFSSLVEALHAGPKQRGQERNKFSLSDGSRGDVYRAILLAIKTDPGRLIPSAQTSDSWG